MRIFYPKLCGWPNGKERGLGFLLSLRDGLMNIGRPSLQGPGQAILSVWSGFFAGDRGPRNVGGDFRVGSRDGDASISPHDPSAVLVSAAPARRSFPSGRVHPLS